MIVALALGLALAIQAWLVKPYQIPSGSISVSARAIPWRTAPAWPLMPPPWTRTRTSRLPS